MFDMVIASLFVGILETIIIHPLPLWIYRYCIKKSPIEPRKAKIIVIVDSIIVIIIMSVLSFLLDGNPISMVAVALWSYVSYRFLTKENSSKDERLDGQTLGSATEISDPDISFENDIAFQSGANGEATLNKLAEPTTNDAEAFYQQSFICESNNDQTISKKKNNNQSLDPLDDESSCCRIQENQSSGQDSFHIVCLILLYISLFLLCGSLLVNFIQYSKSRESSIQIARLNLDINEKDNKLTKQLEEIENQKIKISELEELEYEYEYYKGIADDYDRLCQTIVNNENLGYATNNFHSNESVIVIHENEFNRKFSLTANWNSGGNVSVGYYPIILPSATVSFDNDSWFTSTEMTINPKHTGVTKVTFSNDVDSNTFDIVIIVIE